MCNVDVAVNLQTQRLALLVGLDGYLDGSIHCCRNGTSELVLTESHNQTTSEVQKNRLTIRVRTSPEQHVTHCVQIHRQPGCIRVRHRGAARGVEALNRG